MRKMFGVGLVLLAAMTMPVAAGAAELPVKAPPAPPPPPVFSWTGCYIGGDVGGAWASGHMTDDLHGMEFSTSRSGVVGGPEIGCNYQTGPIVWGIEGNFDWTSLDVSGTGVVAPGVPGTFDASANTDWIADVTGRVGWAAWNQVLLYFKGGGAWVRNSATVTNLTTGMSVSGTNTTDGWLVGGGVEWAFAPSWSVKVEYNYFGLNHFDMTDGFVFPAETFEMRRNIQEAKVGLNWRFNWFNWGGGYTGTRY